MMTMMTMMSTMAMMMKMLMLSNHRSFCMPRHVGEDFDIAGADPELSQQLFHLLLLHPRLSTSLMIILKIIFNFNMFTSMVLLNISNMLMFLFNLSLPVVKTLKVHSENCCLVEQILVKDSIYSYFPEYREKDEDRRLANSASRAKKSSKVSFVIFRSKYIQVSSQKPEDESKYTANFPWL